MKRFRFFKRFFIFISMAGFCVGAVPARVFAGSENVPPSNFSLSELVSIALRDNPLLGSESARIEENVQSGAQAWTWPGFSLDASGGRKRVGSESGLRYEVGVTQPIPLLGKTGLRGGILDLEAEAWRVRRGATEISVTLTVIQSAYEYAVNRRKAGFAEKRQKRFELVLDYLAGREFSTPQKKAESRIVRNRLNALTSDAVLGQAGVKVSLEKLKVHVPLEPGAVPNVTVPWLVGAKTLDEAAWFAKAIDRNPDLLLQKLAVKGAALEKTLASREGLPEPSLGASYEEARAGEIEKTMGLDLSLDLPSWNRNRAGVLSAGQKQTAEEKRLAFEERKFKSDLARLFVEYEAARRVAQQYPETLPVELETHIREAEQGFRRGQVDLLTFLELDDSVSETFGRVQNAQRALADAWTAIMAAVGERDALALLASY